ncbi:ABC transporter permease [Nocardia arthritidis]|uniref:ABC transporter permease subunit n=1 Tax=Nocardia arthritidis TaxID=228602 RepID=A0A6G9YMH0_9NOCA|nr:ABC transporter permease [Nocardia arthritidis]QIS14495.1 ABC transporter permease subunit [Nocardia arthritidis]
MTLVEDPKVPEDPKTPKKKDTVAETDAAGSAVRAESTAAEAETTAKADLAEADSAAGPESVAAAGESAAKAKATNGGESAAEASSVEVATDPIVAEADAAATKAAETPVPPIADRRRILRLLWHNPLGMIGAVLLLIVVFVGVFAPLLAPYAPAAVHFSTPFQRPGTEGFALGTDDLGRDILSRVFHGTRASLEVGALSVLFAVVIGVPLGLLAGYWRWLDTVLSRVSDVLLAFPAIIIAVALTAINGGGLTDAALALGIAQVPVMMRVVRAETLRLKETDFVMAARTMHVPSWRILGEHVLPNALAPIIVQATVIMPTAIIGEAILSFLGLGIKPPAPSLGIMLSDAQQYLLRTPWPGIFPGVALALICLGFNLFGDALRDALDPKTSR